MYILLKPIKVMDMNVLLNINYFWNVDVIFHKDKFINDSSAWNALKKIPNFMTIENNSDGIM